MESIDSDILELLAELSDSESIICIKNETKLKSKGKRIRTSRSKYIVPKVFKNDIRQTYCRMFVNVLSACDVQLLLSFLTVYARPDVQNIDHFSDQSPRNGINAFVKHWYLTTCGSPDIVYRMNCSTVRNCVDGTSELSMELITEGNYIFDKPSLEDKENTSINNESVAQNKRKYDMIVDQHKQKSKMLGRNGLRLSNYVHPNKIRIGPSEDDFMSELDALMPSSIAEQPMYVLAKGISTLTLDCDKRIIKTTFVPTNVFVRPIILNEIC